MSQGHPECGYISESDLSFDLKAKINAAGVKLFPYYNTVTTTAPTFVVNIGIPEFSKESDVIFVIQNTSMITQGQHYTITSDSSSIQRSDIIPWTAGTTFSFVVLKNITNMSTLSDGAFLMDASVPTTKMKTFTEADVTAWKSYATANSAHIYKGVATGSANTYAVSIPEVTSYYDGLTLMVKFPVASSSACTLNVNGLGEKTITSSGNNIVGRSIYQNVYYLLSYVSQWSAFIIATRQDNDVDTNTTQTLSNKTLASPAITGTPTFNGNAMIAATAGDMTLYVATTGNDSTGDGTSGKPYLTIMKAVSMIPKYVQHNVTINLSAGTYAEAVNFNGYVGVGSITLLGASSLVKTHTVTSVTCNRCMCRMYIQGITATGTFSEDCSQLVQFKYCTTDADTKSSNGIGFLTSGGFMWIDSCTVSNKDVGIYTYIMGTTMIINTTGNGNNNAYYIASGEIFIADAATNITGTTLYLNGMPKRFDRAQPQATVQDLTLYVDGTNGNDANAGTSSGTGAKKTIQAAINSLPKVINHNVIINVATGTYPENVSVGGFSGGGTFTLQGDTVASTTRTVNRIFVETCTIFDTKIIGFNASTTADYSFSVRRCGGLVWIQNCQTTAATSYGIHATAANVYAWNNVISNHQGAVIASTGAIITTLNNTGSGNTGGLTAFGGILIKQDNVIPGATVAEGISNGGIIINSDGTLGGMVGKAMMGMGAGYPGQSGTMTVAMDSSMKPALIPAGNCVLNASGGYVGQTCILSFLTSGTTSYTISFGTGFLRTQGNIVTGATNSKFIDVSFVCDGTYWYETGRTSAM